MLFDKKTKKQVISEFAQSKNDTGSTEVQCAIITKKINTLTEHLKIHKKDHFIHLDHTRIRNIQCELLIYY